MKRPRYHRLTPRQLAAMIPAGAVPSIRAARDAIDTEPVAIAETGRALLMRQVVSTPVRKLLKQGAITAIEADAANLLRSDHDAAYGGSRCILAATQVDGGRNGGGSDDARLQRSDRYRRAMRFLCPELRRVASIGIVDATAGIPATFLAIGRLMLPGASGAEQTGGGKAALVITCRELAVFYGLTRRAM
jgi:hypothetical protein